MLMRVPIRKAALCLALAAQFGTGSTQAARGAAFANDRPARGAGRLVQKHAAAEHGAIAPEVVIIGTIHQGTKLVTKDDLLAAIARVHPDLICFENPIDWFKPEELPPGKAVEHPVGVSIENQAMNAYVTSQAGANCSLRPFDIAGRNAYYERTNFFEKQKRATEAVADLAEKGKLPDANALRVEKVAMADRTMTAFLDENLEYFNRRPFLVASRLRYQAIASLEPVFDSTPALSAYKQFYGDFVRWWDHRNRVMGRNILTWTRNMSAQRVVVLTGADHKYFLHDELRKKEAKGKILLREYWEYPSPAASSKAPPQKNAPAAKRGG